MDQLAALRAFVRIVETGSFTQAAESLRTPKPTVTKLIQELEAHLQTKLLNRTTRRTAVTVDGAAYFERATRLLADLEELDGSLLASQMRPKGRLRVDMSASLAQLVIIPALDGFFARYPDIQLDIGASDRQADLVAENVDCVIRAGTLTDPSLIARRVAGLAMTTCAAPGYLDRFGTPGQPSELENGHVRVGYFDASSGRPRDFRFIRGTETIELQGHHRLSVNEASTYLAAGLAGHGVIQVPLFMVRRHLQSGALRPVLAEWSVPPLPLHIVYRPNRHLSAKLRIFVDWIVGLLASPPFASNDMGRP